MIIGGRIDANQPEVVDALRKAGCLVSITSDFGGGFPDLLVKTPKGRVWMVEVKDGSAIPSRQRLTDKEKAWQAKWGDTYVVVTSINQAIALART
jgi:hypothetical protein